jgi:hypothetical protein
MFNSSEQKEPTLIKIDGEQDAFLVKNVFASDKDSIHISRLEDNNKLVLPRLYLQAFPSYIPVLNTSNSVLKPQTDYRALASLNLNSFKVSSLKNVQQLDEVVVLSEIDQTRIRANKLKAEGRWGDVNVISEGERNAFYFLEDYLRTKGIIVIIPEGDRSQMWLSTGRQSRQPRMDIFIDDLWVGKSFQSRWPMQNVDYVEINKQGLDPQGGGLRGAGGIIKIYTNPKIPKRNNTASKGQTYAMPLTFSSNKKFYVPEYQYYNDDFYKGYGTIDWKPNLSLDANGDLNITIATPEVPITLFIEGITNNGTFIYEEQSISLN